MENFHELILARVGARGLLEIKQIGRTLRKFALHVVNNESFSPQH